MPIKVVRNEKDTLIIEVIEESETFLNLLREELWNIDGVKEAAFFREHPELDNPKLFIKMEKGSPKKALEKAISNLMKKLEELKKVYLKAVQ